MCLVPEMRSGIEQIVHGNDRCRHSLFPSG
jgi:hypothetical protein